MTVLVVDDAAFSRGMICRFLGAAGYATLQAKDGIEALEVLENCQPGQIELIVTDMLMPRMTGSELLKELARLGVSVPTIVLTADIQATTREKCTRLGCAAFMNKPVTAEPLRMAVETALTERRAAG
ncbi:MAG: response regulator [Nannocystaceae bacterium]